IAGSPTNAHDTGRGVAIEYSSILGEGDLARGVLCRLPVGVIGATIDVVDCLAVQLERSPQLDQCLYLSLPGDDAVSRRRDLLQVAGADGGQARACRTLYVNHAPSCEVAL